jgi:hypothetical protein
MNSNENENPKGIFMFCDDLESHQRLAGEVKPLPMAIWWLSYVSIPTKFTAITKIHLLRLLYLSIEQTQQML